MLQNLQNEVALMEKNFFVWTSFTWGNFSCWAPANGLSIGQKINFLKYEHIIHQSAANFMHIKRNIRTLFQNQQEKSYNHLHYMTSSLIFIGMFLL